MNGLLAKYAYIYTNDNRAAMAKFKTWEETVAWLKKHDVVEAFAAYADKHGLPRRNLLIRKSYRLLQTYLYGYIIDDLLGRDALTRYLNSDDNCVQTALKLMDEGKAFPQKPAEKTDKKKKNGKERTAQVGFGTKTEAFFSRTV